MSDRDRIELRMAEIRLTDALTSVHQSIAGGSLEAIRRAREEIRSAALWVELAESSLKALGAEAKDGAHADKPATLPEGVRPLAKVRGGQ
jgi:hypothetical protein